MNTNPASFPENHLIPVTNPVMALGMLHLAMVGVASIEVICG